MSEIECFHYCPHCMKETQCMFGGSGHNGFCMECSKELPKSEYCDFSRIICQNVVDLESRGDEDGV